MILTSEQEVVFLKADGGTFVSEDGQKIDWNKISFANPSTYENHEMSYNPGLSFKNLQKGERLVLGIEMIPTSKKSKFLVSSYEVI